MLSADLGTIEVQMWRVDKFVPSENHYSLGDIAEIGTVHEKSKKAGVHIVSWAMSLFSHCPTPHPDHTGWEQQKRKHRGRPCAMLA